MSNIPGCVCSGKIQNSGDPGGALFSVVVSTYVVPLLADDGIKNYLDLTAANLGTELLSKVNHTDPSKRFYPYHQLKNVTKEQPEGTFETSDNDERFKLRSGIKTVAYEMWAKTNQYFGKVSDVCPPFGIIEVDECGNIRGTLSGTELHPRKVNQYSYDSRFMDKTNAAASKIMVSFDFDRLTADADQWMVPASAFGVLSPLFINGMVDVNLTITPLTATTLTVVAELPFGTALERLKFRGGLLANFTLFNVTDASTIALDTVVENVSVPGEYLVTIDAADTPTTADVVSVTVFKAATTTDQFGYESQATNYVSL
jgi:hypothetical protein